MLVPVFPKTLCLQRHTVENGSTCCAGLSTCSPVSGAHIPSDPNSPLIELQSIQPSVKEGIGSSLLLFGPQGTCLLVPAFSKPFVYSVIQPKNGVLAEIVFPSILQPVSSPVCSRSSAHVRLTLTRPHRTPGAPHENDRLQCPKNQQFDTTLIPIKYDLRLKKYDLRGKR